MIKTLSDANFAKKLLKEEQNDISKYKQTEIDYLKVVSCCNLYKHAFHSKIFFSYTCKNNLIVYLCVAKFS